MKRVWQTFDGKSFEDAHEAREHEANLFDGWMTSALMEPYPLKVSEVLGYFKRLEESEDADEHCELVELLRTYWEGLQ